MAAVVPLVLVYAGTVVGYVVYDPKSVLLLGWIVGSLATIGVCLVASLVCLVKS